MTKREYSVFLHTPLGKRQGKLSVCKNENTLYGTLTILGHTLPFTGECDQSGSCVIKGTFKTLLRTVAYTAKGHISETEVALEMEADRNSFLMSGNIILAEGETA